MKKLIYTFLLTILMSCGIFDGNGDGYGLDETADNYSPGEKPISYYQEYFLKEVDFQCLDPATSEMIDSYKEKLVINSNNSITIFDDLCSNQIIQENLNISDLTGLNKNNENKFEDIELDDEIFNFQWP